ncbi:helix-turn-helix transcriptional regulator [Amycolatopsis sp. NPDC089917]|uniref:helix-turn-helix domain-containing protein n=1 Tax=Amycolatopsis sp. NPDC089917 TaxID=3155187 RepID=UPI00343AA23F
MAASEVAREAERLSWNLNSNRRPCPDTSRIGGWIRYSRVVRNMSIEGLAKRADLSASHLTYIEMGYRPLTSVELSIRLADALGQDAVSFMMRAIGDLAGNQRAEAPEVEPV